MEGEFSVPVTEHSPLSACTKKSYAFLLLASLLSPYPVILHEINLGFSFLKLVIIIPNLSRAPGAKLLSKISDFNISFLINIRSISFLRFKQIDSLPRLSQAKIQLLPLTALS